MNTSLNDPKLKGVSFDLENRMMRVDLQDGRAILVPLCWYPRLDKAAQKDLAVWESIADEGIHWPTLDEDISIEGILLGKTAPIKQLKKEPLTPEKLQEFRTRLLGMSQKQLAEALDYGLSTIQAFEHGTREIKPRFETAFWALVSERVT